MLKKLATLFRRKRPHLTSPPKCPWCDDGTQCQVVHLGVESIGLMNKPCLVCGGVGVLPAVMVRENAFHGVPKLVWGRFSEN